MPFFLSLLYRKADLGPHSTETGLIVFSAFVNLIGFVAGLTVILNAFRLRFWQNVYQRMAFINAVSCWICTCARILMWSINSNTQNIEVLGQACLRLKHIELYFWVGSNCANCAIIFTYLLLNVAGKKKKRPPKENYTIAFFLFLISVCFAILSTGLAFTDIVYVFESYCWITSEDTQRSLITSTCITVAHTIPMILGVIMFTLARTVFKYKPPKDNSSIYTWHKTFKWLTISFFVAVIPDLVGHSVSGKRIAPMFITAWTSIQNLTDGLILFKYIFVGIEPGGRSRRSTGGNSGSPSPKAETISASLDPSSLQIVSV